MTAPTAMEIMLKHSCQTHFSAFISFPGPMAGCEGSGDWGLPSPLTLLHSLLRPSTNRRERQKRDQRAFETHGSTQAQWRVLFRLVRDLWHYFFAPAPVRLAVERRNAPTE